MAVKVTLLSDRGHDMNVIQDLLRRAAAQARVVWDQSARATYRCHKRVCEFAA